MSKKFETISAFEKYKSMNVINPYVFGNSIPRSGLYAEYLFDNNYADTSGNGLDLSEVIGSGSATIVFEANRKGIASKSVRFNNTTANYKVLYRGSTTTVSIYSVSFWTYKISNVPNVDIPVDLKYSTERFVIYNAFDSGKSYYGNTPLLPGSEYPNNTWQHHVINRNVLTGLKEYYLNGVLKVSNNSDVIAAFAPAIQLGCGVGSAPCNCRLDDLRIYNRLLTIAEITALFNE